MGGQENTLIYCVVSHILLSSMQLHCATRTVSHLYAPYLYRVGSQKCCAIEEFSICNLYFLFRRSLQFDFIFISVRKCLPDESLVPMLVWCCAARIFHMISSYFETYRIGHSCFSFFAFLSYMPMPSTFAFRHCSDTILVIFVYSLVNCVSFPCHIKNNKSLEAELTKTLCATIRTDCTDTAAFTCRLKYVDRRLHSYMLNTHAQQTAMMASYQLLLLAASYVV